MGKLALVILFYWITVFENISKDGGVFYELGGGLELRFSLVLKIVFLVLNLFYLLKHWKKVSIPKIIFIPSLFLIASSSYVYFVNSAYLISAFSVCLHVILMLNIALYIYFYARSYNQINKMLKGLRIFGMVNAILVIVSFFANDLFSGFEAGSGNSDLVRAFGIMGDQVSSFMTYFFFDALIRKKRISLFIYTTAIAFTAGIGATIVTISLFLYYLLFIKKIKWSSLFYSLIIGIILISTAFIAIPQLKELGVIKRVINNIESPDTESGNMRIISIYTALQMIKERPLLGYGYGAYGYMVMEKYEPMFKKLGFGWRLESAKVILQSAFNPFIQIICDAGIIGLILFIIFLRKIYSILVFARNSVIKSIKILSTIDGGWFMVFCITTISVNWMLPSSFLFLLIVTLLGVHLKINKFISEYSLS